MARRIICAATIVGAVTLGGSSHTEREHTRRLAAVPASHIDLRRDYNQTRASRSQPIKLVTPTTVARPATRTYASIGQINDLSGVLACIRRGEAGGDYATETGNGFHGAYQFMQKTWDSAARALGRGDLIGVPAGHASPADQDALATWLFHHSKPLTQWPNRGACWS